MTDEEQLYADQVAELDDLPEGDVPGQEEAGEDIPVVPFEED